MMTEEEREIYEERVAIIMIDGKMPESYARIVAFKQIEEMRKKRNEQRDDHRRVKENRSLARY